MGGQVGFSVEYWVSRKIMNDMWKWKMIWLKKYNGKFEETGDDETWCFKFKGKCGKKRKKINEK